MRLLRPFRTPLLPVATLPVIVATPPVFADGQVAVRATALPDYVQQRDLENGAKRVEKYVFLEGRFFEGAIRDRTLENTELEEIARALAPHLAEQNYFPTRDAADADLVIAVHWGMTVSLRHNRDYVVDLMERAHREQQVAQEFFDATYRDEEGQEIVPIDYAQGLLQENARNAAAAPDYEWARMASSRSDHEIDQRPMATVLGFADILNRDAKRAFSSEEARTVRAWLNEERYFVVLMAYDLKSRENGKPLERVWVARLSIPAAGVNFREAVERLGEAGSTYYGTDQPKLAVERTRREVPEGEVEIGDAIVIEAESAGNP